MTSRPANPTEPVNAHLKMSPAARERMRATEKAVYRYYNDMGKNKVNCTWGAGILAHKGVCTPEELATKVSASMIDHEFERRVAEAERAVRRSTSVPLNQAQFDALCSLTYNAGAKGDIASLDEHEAQQLVGHVFVISKEKVKFDERDCGPTGFEAVAVVPELHLRKEFHANAQKLRLPNPVTVVDLSCTSVFIKNRNKLVIAWKGWFFDAVRLTP